MPPIRDSFETNEKTAPPIGEEDPRVILAAERTLLAWIRTGLAMMGFGFLVAKFGLFLQEIELLRGGQPQATPRWSVGIGIAMVVLGSVANFAASLEHLTYWNRYRRSSYGFGVGYRLGIAAGLLLATIGAFMVVQLLRF